MCVCLTCQAFDKICCDEILTYMKVETEQILFIMPEYHELHNIFFYSENRTGFWVFVSLIGFMVSYSSWE